jgi:hypothetical protein
MLAIATRNLIGWPRFQRRHHRFADCLKEDADTSDFFKRLAAQFPRVSGAHGRIDITDLKERIAIDEA